MSLCCGVRPGTEDRRRHSRNLISQLQDTSGGGAVGRTSAKASASRSESSHEFGAVLVAYDARDGPAHAKKQVPQTVAEACPVSTLTI